jgi:hypothetical protein
MASAAANALVAFEVDHLDHSAGQAWSVLVRGLAIPVADGEGHPEADVTPVPLVASPGDEVLVIRLDVVTGRRFRLDKHSVAHGYRDDAAPTV